MVLRTILAGLFSMVSAGAMAIQTIPSDIAKKDLPKAAVCVVCEANGEGHNAEKPAGGVRYRDKSFYFCNAKEVAEFKKDPEAFMPPVLPRPATTLKVKTLEGTDAGLVDFKGKVVLIDWWATWCAPCVAAMPDVQKLHANYTDKGFSAVGVSIDEDGAKKVKPFIAKRKFTYPILLDGNAVWKTWGVRAIPALFLVDKNGQIVRQWTGKVDFKEIEKAIVDQFK